MKTKIRIIGAAAVAVLWLVLSVMAWVKPADSVSLSERRDLEQFPEITGKNLLSGDFMADFEDYTLDQFPMRDTFRRMKALFHYNILQQKDNNDIIIHDGYQAEMNYPLNRKSLDFALVKFNFIYNQFLKDSGSKIYLAVVPEKTAYLPENSGYLTMDHQALAEYMAKGMPYATNIDLYGSLSLDSYYRTDTHWRQECLIPVAQQITQAMGMTPPQPEEFTVTGQERPFYGVHYGHAAMPVEPDTMYFLESDRLDQCSTWIVELDAKGQRVTRKLYDGVYDLEKLSGDDMYEAFLSGTQGILRIENPNASTDRELIIFRDSYGSSIAPLLVQEYASVTLVDIRSVFSTNLSYFLDFHGQDVLFLYSTLVLNNSSTLK